MVGNWVEQVMDTYDVPKDVAEQLVLESAKKVNAQRRLKEELSEIRKLSYQEWLDTERSDPQMRWDYQWIRYVVPYIQAVIDGDIRWLILNIPPRTGKTSLLTIRLPVYWLERNPYDGVLLGSYGGGLATEFAQASLDIYRERNPDKIESESKEKWTNIFGGFEYPVGVGGGVTGRGGELILVDDPVKSWQEANSRVYMNLVWNWFLNDLRSRRNHDRVPIIIVHTRWGDDDLTGRLMNSPEAKYWTRITVPALALTQGERDVIAAKYNEPIGLPDPLGREPGEAILPERFSAQSLRLLEATDAQGFASLYQQLPIQIALASFKTEHFNMISEAPIAINRVRYWDSAATPGKGDWTVGVLMGMAPDGRIIVEDVVRGQWAEDDVDRQMRQTAIIDNYTYGSLRGQPKEVIAKLLEAAAKKPGAESKSEGDPETEKEEHIDVSEFIIPSASAFNARFTMQTWIEQEPAASGKKVAAVRKRVVFVGMDVYSETAQGNKSVRARPWASAVNNGNVDLVIGAWNHEYIQEHRLFVIGVDHQLDDQVDASSGCYMKLAIDMLKVTIA